LWGGTIGGIATQKTLGTNERVFRAKLSGKGNICEIFPGLKGKRRGTEMGSRGLPAKAGTVTNSSKILGIGKGEGKKGEYRKTNAGKDGLKW